MLTYEIVHYKLSLRCLFGMSCTVLTELSTSVLKYFVFESSDHASDRLSFQRHSLLILENKFENKNFSNR